jgi:glycosyltransferase involved in cell wall biosynthesis
MGSPHATANVSVVVPARNVARYIGEALRSILAQTLRPAEVIVVDDGSDDGTADVARSFGPAVCVLANDGRGVAAALNRGVRESRSEFIAHFDADDVMRPNKLARQMAVMGSPRAEGLGLVASDLVMFDEKGPDPSTLLDLRPLLRRQFPPDADGVIWLTSAEACHALCHEHCIDVKGIYPKRVWSALGGFDTSLSCANDMEFVWRVATRFPVAVVEEVLIEGRRHATNISKNGKLVAEECTELFRRMLRHPLCDEDRRVVRGRIAKELYDLADAYRRSSRYGMFALNYVKSASYLARRPRPA